MAEEDGGSGQSSGSSSKKSSGKIFGLNYFVFGALVIGGIVLAWYLKDHVFDSSSGSTTVTTSGDGVTGSGVTSGSGSGSTAPSTSTTPATSAISTWLTNAENFANQLSLDDNTVSSALTSYIAGQPVAAGAQTTTLQAILNGVGDAPGIGAPQTSTSTTPAPTTAKTPSVQTIQTADGEMAILGVVGSGASAANPYGSNLSSGYQVYGGAPVYYGNADSASQGLSQDTEGNYIYTPVAYLKDVYGQGTPAP